MGAVVRLPGPSRVEGGDNCQHRNEGEDQDGQTASRIHGVHGPADARTHSRTVHSAEYSDPVGPTQGEAMRAREITKRSGG